MYVPKRETNLKERETSLKERNLKERNKFQSKRNKFQSKRKYINWHHHYVHVFLCLFICEMAIFFRCFLFNFFIHSNDDVVKIKVDAK